MQGYFFNTLYPKTRQSSFKREDFGFGRLNVLWGLGMGIKKAG